VLYGPGIRHIGSVNAQLLAPAFSLLVEAGRLRTEAIAAIYINEIAQSWFRIPLIKPDFNDSKQLACNWHQGGNHK